MMRIDFGKNNTSWRTVTDRVMGGVSEAEVELTENTLILKGHISLENNGGFASILSEYDKFDLSPYNKVRIRLRYEGQDFALKLKRYRAHDKPSYKHMLPEAKNWKTLTLYLSDFEQFIKSHKTGQQLTDSEAAQIVAISLISQRAEEGDYYLEVDYLEFV